jgi:hypothetical protein
MKVVAVLEYEVPDDSTTFNPNIALEDEAGARPTRIHLLQNLPALKVLSIVEAAQVADA